MPLLRQLPVGLDDLLLVGAPKQGQWRQRGRPPDSAAEASDRLPADAEDLVVIPLLGDFQQFLRSLQTFFDFLLVIKVQRLFVVLHS